MKNNTLHEKAKVLLMDKMKMIIDNIDPKIREINISGFIDSINDEMIKEDEDKAFGEMGVMSTREKGKVKKLTPEEIAASEAERDLMMQRELETAIIKTVMGIVDNSMQST